ncbi:UvrD-helicase domain-containing protein [uncultured Draconibacterium sp.]|uniref:UvrD-helicase domain-containing protein n=1 Tax=uncultured Draconibacterium sp. TaxID=1573823 RepID=UPI0029BFDE88|nr:UvrD-helicase domain-containing protein [uncultured Draconibacterium sp.]
MSSQINDNNIDNSVDDIIFECLKLESPKSFFLFAGAGSGKTRSLVNVLEKFEHSYGKQFRLERKKIATITYTNAAADEINHRLKHSSIFHVSTIHSFAWDLIKTFTLDIKQWLRENLQDEISDLEGQQSKSRNLQNKTSIERAKKIESKQKRVQYLDRIVRFTYNPNGDNTTKDSLNHSEVISIAAFFINTKSLMRDLLICKYPIVLIDESQDTKKELIDAFFLLQSKNQDSFSLGLFGDTMQRIYFDGKENLGRNLPADMIQPAKQMNHRSNKRIITLINNIRKDVDGQEQISRVEKDEGFVRFFICERGLDKTEVEKLVANKMSDITNDIKWSTQSDDYEIKTLILEHHMAARRMGFLTFFEPLYKVGRLKTGLLDGSLGSVNFFTQIILPLVEAHNKNEKFEIARIIKKHSRFLKKEELIKNPDQVKNIKEANEALASLFSLFAKNEPTLLDVLKNVYQTGLFPIPESLLPIASSSVEKDDSVENEDKNPDDLLIAWGEALLSPFSQVKNYNEYLSESSKFGTHQGVKGLEYERVMVIIDDEEANGKSFSYDKLFGAKDMSPNDRKNIDEGKETGIDKTNRLFYVACSRAKDSLTIVAYTDDIKAVKDTVLENGWFTEDEIEIVN